MNRPEHIVIALVCGVGLYAVDIYLKKREANLGEALCTAGGAFLGGGFPDDIEPATDPNHRKFFHSLTLAILFELGADKLIDTYQLNNYVSCFIKGFVHGNTSHILSDSTTPKGVKLI